MRAHWISNRRISDRGGDRIPAVDLLRRARWFLVALAVILLVLASLIARPRPLLLWNISASAPEGLYFVSGKHNLARGDMVAARLPAGFRLLAARRGYLPMNVPLVKRVAGVAGDLVCASGDGVRINGRFVAERLAVDRREREMPWWSGCLRLADGEYFLIMSNAPASFDGRYFGVSSGDDIIGKAMLLWRS